MTGLALASIACRDRAPTQSHPITQQVYASGRQDVELGAIPVPVTDPVDVPTLTTRFPALSTLSEDARLQTVGVLNLTAAPCVPCWESSSLAQCLLVLPPGCENLPTLLDRAVRLAAAGQGVAEIREAIAYGEPWVADESAAQTEQVDGELWLAPRAVFAQRALDRLAEVETPQTAWRIRPLVDDAPDATDAALGLLAAEEQGAGRAFLRALAADVSVEDAAAKAGLDMARWQALRGTPALAAQLAEEQVVSRTKGVRTTPVWFVEGYRLRGLQGAESISRLIELAQEDTARQ